MNFSVTGQRMDKERSSMAEPSPQRAYGRLRAHGACPPVELPRERNIACIRGVYPLQWRRVLPLQAIHSIARPGDRKWTC